MEMTHLKAHEVVNMKFSDFAVVVRYINDGAKVELWWTDYVANEWEEVYDTLAESMTRLALLLECMESDWDKGFVCDAASHQRSHSQFVSANIG